MDLSQPYQLAIFLITVFTMALQLFVIYLVVCFSPASMAVYRRYLIASTVCDLMFMFNIGIVFMPETGEFAPGSGYFVRGISANLGETVYNLSGSGVYFFAVLMLAAQDISLAYRVCAVFPNNEYCRKFSSLPCTMGLIAISILTAFIMSAGHYHAIADPRDHKEILDTYTMNSIGETIPLDLETPRLMLYNNRPYMKQFIKVVGICLFTSECLYFAGVYLILRTLKSYSGQFSRRSIRLHRQLTVLLAVQVAAPVLLFSFPVLHLFIQLDRRPMNTRIRAQIGMLVFLCHSFVMSLLVVLLITPYRQYVLGKLAYIIYPSKACTRLTLVQVSSVNAPSMYTSGPEL